MRTIAELGFKPRVHVGDLPAKSVPATADSPIPEPIAEAVAKARETGQLVFIDFYAEWCAPCRVLDGEILVDSRVLQALRGFVVVKVDTDVAPKAGERFSIAGLPTVLVLDGKGRERYRHTGLIEPAHLAARLLEVLSGSPVPKNAR